MTSKPASMRIAGILYDSLSGWVDAPTTAMVVAHSRTPRRSWSPRTAPATPGGLFEPWVVVTRFQTSREGELFLRFESAWVAHPASFRRFFLFCGASPLAESGFEPQNRKSHPFAPAFRRQARRTAASPLHRSVDPWQGSPRLPR